MLLQDRQRLDRIVLEIAQRFGRRLPHPFAQGTALLAGFGAGQDDVVGEGQEIGGLAVGAARDHHRAAFEDRLFGPGRRHGETVDLLRLERRLHVGRLHHRDMDIVLAEPGALRQHADIGVNERVDRVDGDGLAAQQEGALLERRRRVEARHELLAQHDLDDRVIGRLGDGEELLAMRGRAGERDRRRHAELGAARDHPVDRADARQHDALHPKPVLLIEPDILGDEFEAEGQAVGRQADHDVLKLLRLGARRRHRKRQQSGRDGVARKRCGETRHGAAPPEQPFNSSRSMPARHAPLAPAGARV
jgi:hypothetical protein